MTRSSDWAGKAGQTGRHDEGCEEGRASNAPDGAGYESRGEAVMRAAAKHRGAWRAAGGEMRWQGTR